MFRGGVRPSTSNATMKRIQREIRDLEKEDMGDITLKPSESNVFNWSATIPGPEGSVYEGGIFKLSIVLPQDYPFSAPRVTFDTRIYHMNIAPNGGICIDVLKSQWSPALSLFKVMLSISSLLCDPNPQDPLVPTIAQEYLRDRAAHDKNAREWTKLYALPAAPSEPKGKAKAAQTSTPQPQPQPQPRSSSSRATSTIGRSNAPTPQPLALPNGVAAGASSSRGGRATEPIEIDDDDDVPSEPSIPTRPAAAARASRAARRGAASTAQPPAAVAGTKRRQQNGDVEETSGSSTATSSRTTRSAKRRTLERGEGGADDAIVID